MQTALQPINAPQPAVDYRDPSVWGRLNDIFKSKFMLCDKDGNLLNDGRQVVAVAIEGHLSHESNWATPFDSSNPENKLPTLLGGLQSGTLTDFAGAMASKLGMGDSLAENLQKAEGRSSFTKVNSTQIFLSNSSVQVNMTVIFRAWRNARTEVENQVGLLHQMAVPQMLSDDSIAAGQLENPSLSFEGFMPSLIPPYITLYHAKRSYTPLILQSFSRDIVGNMTEHGDMVYLEVPITLLSRQAWDSHNVGKLYNLPGLK
ncbi:hypothetical protein [Acinetobacter colistiniresistens]|uniref:hypothetical protein n=1 Tax=Acinetobacter colistiniresistens TaxID=280145 RepID=UPI001250BC65|nr:hypothetical protein [Acinetobacter colistiniresistens]